MQDTSKEGDTQEEEITAERETNVLVKTNCKCCMVISERKGVWRITRLILDHNHALSPGAKIFRAHKNMTEQEKKMIKMLNECNIPTKTKTKSKLWSNYYIERQAQEAYNLKIFKKFQWQLRRATKLQATEN